MRSLHGLVVLFCLAFPTVTPAGVVIDFDALPAKGSPVSGAALSSYLAPFGVALTGATPGTTVTVYDARDIYADIQPVIPVSAWNVIGQAGSLDPISYSMSFSVAQDWVSFYRVGVRAGRTGVALPEWRVTAFDAGNNPLGSVGENAFSIFVNDLPAKKFTLGGPGIARILIASNNYHFAAFGSGIFDSFELSTAAVPEPGTLGLFAVGGAAALGLSARRRREVRAD